MKSRSYKGNTLHEKYFLRYVRRHITVEGIKSVILWIGVNSLEDNLDYFTDEAIAGLGPAEGGAASIAE